MKKNNINTTTHTKKIEKIWIFIVYDSIHNSVFVSQTLLPFEKTLQQKQKKGILISFETKVRKSQKQIHQIKEKLKISNIDFVVLKKFPFLGRPALWHSSLLLKKILLKYNYEKILARGPLAGFIVTKTKLKNRCDITVQARGLAAAEYLFSFNKTTKNPIKRTIKKFLYNSLLKIEKFVYGPQSPINKIEVISPTLKNYLIQKFQTPKRKIIYATADIPPQLPPKIRNLWRQRIRNRLKIPEKTTVYVYNGSFKSWQCPIQTITQFKKIHRQKPDSFLLILTTDKTKFQKCLRQENLNKKLYKILTVPATDIYKYLSAADKGFLLREKNIINWVSRPTKMLEYQACNLEIIHNNNIAWLTKHSYRLSQKK